MTTQDDTGWRGQLPGLADRVAAAGHAWRPDPATEDTDDLLVAVSTAQVALDRAGAHALSREVLDLYEQALAAEGVDAADPRWGQAAFRRLLLVERLGGVGEALERAEALIEQADTHGWNRVLVSVLRRMGFLAGLSGDRRRQEAVLNRALSLARELGDPIEEGDVLRYISNYQLNRGDPDAALVSMQRARALFVQGGADRVRIAQIDTPIGGRLVEQQELGRAQTILEGALAVFEDVRHAWGETECLLNLGRILEMEGDLEGATERVRQAQAVMTRVGDPRGLARCGNRLGEIHRRVGQLREAEGFYLEALAAAEQADHVNLRALVLSNLAQVREAQGRPSEARALVEQSLALPGLQRTSEAGLRVLLLPFLELEGRTDAWEEQYHLARVCLRNTDRFQRDVALAARRSGAAAVESATLASGDARMAALSRAARSHALAWHHWSLMGFPSEETAEEKSLQAVGQAGAPVPLGEFDLSGRLGVGGMGEVWRAVHRSSGVPVAVKVLTAARARSQVVQASFRAEVRAMAGLNHPHVALVLGQGTIDVPASRATNGRLEPGNPYLVMELAPEGSLEHRCGRLRWDQVRQILLALLQGLAHAHARGLIHRDLKPANVLLGTGETLGDQVRLTDFGVAAAMGQGDRLSRVAAGTPGYMAPEQFLARWRDQGPWTDLYALGCLATELVQGSPPFTASTLSELMKLHLQADPPSLDPAVAVPPGFEAWLHRLLQKHPADRYQRAVDAAAALAAMGAPVARAPREPALRAFPDTVSESTLFLEDLFGVTSLETEPRPAPLPPATPPSLAAEPPQDPGVRAGLAQAGLSLFGLRVLPLVGRTVECRVLWQSLRATLSSGQPHGVVLQGPPGIGRSRLVAWLGEHAHALAGATVVSVSHTPQAEADAPLRSLLGSWLGLKDLGPAELGARLAAPRDDSVMLTPDEQQLLVDFLGDRAAGPARERRHLRTLVTRMLVDAARHRPLVLLLDDVQWGDDSLALATALMRSGAPTLVVLSARDDGAATPARLTRRLGAFSAHPGVSVLPLGPLTPTAFRGLVRDQLGLGPELAKQVEARADGHPAFAVQLVADWLARGVLQAGEGGLALRVGGKASVPDGLQAAWSLPVERLVQRFGSDGRGALEIAALLGQRVDASEWAAACEAEGFPVPDGLVDALLDERLIRQDGSAWAFLHAPFRECLEHLAKLGGRLARWHRACAQALASRADAQARRGRHRTLGGRPAEGFEDLVVALEHASPALTPERRQRLIDDTLDALDALGASPEDTRRARWARAAEAPALE